MKLDSIRLKNYKCFEDCTIEFAPITIFAGANSSGKSAALSALAAISQGEEEKIFPFSFPNVGKNINLGGYKEISKGSNTKNSFSIEANFTSNEEKCFISGSYRYSPSGNYILPNKVITETGIARCEITWEGQESGYNLEINQYFDFEKNKVSIQKFIHSMLEAQKSINPDISSIQEEQIDQAFSEMFSKSPKPISIPKSSSNRLLSEIKTSGFPHISDDIKNKINSLFSKFHYIGPIRAHPSRHHETKFVPNHVDPYGENAYDLILDWKKHSTAKYKQLQADLSDLHLAEKIDVKNIKDDLVEITVKPYKHAETVNISDVGFGISQILPIIVSNIGSSKEATLLINQPEVHLHPSAQAALGNYFSNYSKEKRFIIESHSEYLITRLRLLVATKKLKKSDVRIVFFSPEEDTPSTITIDDKGSLKGAPKSFFETYFIDNNELIMASLK